MLWLHCRVAVLPPREVRAPAPKVVELPRRGMAGGYREQWDVIAPWYCYGASR